jgi:hypothetical protein
VQTRPSKVCHCPCVRPIPGSPEKMEKKGVLCGGATKALKYSRCALFEDGATSNNAKQNFI